MSEYFDNQKKPSSNFRKLLQERMDNPTPRHNLTAEETKLLAKLESIADKLSRGENVKKRQLQTWLSDDHYTPFDPHPPLPNQQDDRTKS